MPSASEKLAAFFDVLRDTGTEIPISNVLAAQLFKAGIDNLDIDHCAEFREMRSKDTDRIDIARDNLSADLEVIIESLSFAEDDDDEDEAEEDDTEESDCD